MAAASASAPAAFEALIGKVDRDPRSGEVLWRVRSDDRAVDVTYGDPGRRLSIASATKLYVTAILAQFRAEGRLDWDAPALRGGACSRRRSSRS